MPLAQPTTMIFNFPDPINVSLQVGDNVYYCPSQGHGGFQTVDPNITTTFIVYIGKCTLVQQVGAVWQVHVLIQPGLTVNQSAAIVNTYIGGNRFLMFNKNTETNRNSLLGYYAEVKLGNDSPNIAELFAVSTEASESSK